MDQGLIAWGRAVKQRRGKRSPPPLWLFTEPVRMDDLPGLVARLPKHLCGIVYRHEATPERAALGQAIAKLCRIRRIALVVAGDARLAARLHAGLHYRGGRRPGFWAPLRGTLTTASVHNYSELLRARRAGCRILFISPVFPTESHPATAGLGVLRWARLARQAAPASPYALGGVNGLTVRFLGAACAGAGAIAAFLGAEPAAGPIQTIAEFNLKDAEIYA